MKFLLDEMYDPRIARQLDRRRGIDARGIETLRGKPDAEVFGIAQLQERAIVTENVADFIPLANQALAAGAEHHGLVLTSNTSFPRARPATTSAMVNALALLTRTTVDLRSQIVWLQPQDQVTR